MKSKLLLANLIFAFHVLIFLLVFFGWAFPRIWPIYMTTLAVVLFTDLYFGYCFLSKWEFTLRHMVDPKIRYKYSFTSYYTYKLIGQRLPMTFVQWIGMFFVGSSLLINFYFHFLY